eukprot:scaffold3808_cov112-Isochrysis_galbana.AAC.41
MLYEITLRLTTLIKYPARGGTTNDIYPPTTPTLAEKRWHARDGRVRHDRRLPSRARQNKSGLFTPCTHNSHPYIPELH